MSKEYDYCKTCKNLKVTFTYGMIGYCAEQKKDVHIRSIACDAYDDKRKELKCQQGK